MAAFLEDLSKAKGPGGIPMPLMLGGVVVLLVVLMVAKKDAPAPAMMVGGPGANVEAYRAQLEAYEGQQARSDQNRRDAMSAAISLKKLGHEHELATYGAHTQRIGVEGQLGNQRLSIQSGERVALSDIGARERVGMADVSGRTQVGLAQIDMQRSVGMAQVSMQRDLGMRGLDIQELQVGNTFKLGMRDLDIKEKGVDYGFSLGKLQLTNEHDRGMYGLETNRIRDGQVHDQTKQENTWNGWGNILGAIVGPVMKLFGWA